MEEDEDRQAEGEDSRMREPQYASKTITHPNRRRDEKEKRRGQTKQHERRCFCFPFALIALVKKGWMDGC